MVFLGITAAVFRNFAKTSNPLTKLFQKEASSITIGTVLSQDSIGSDHQIAFDSRTLCPAERRYSCVGRVAKHYMAVKHFRPYLFCIKLKIVTDHGQPIWLLAPLKTLVVVLLDRVSTEYYYEKIYKVNHFQECACSQAKILANNETEID